MFRHPVGYQIISWRPHKVSREDRERGGREREREIVSEGWRRITRDDDTVSIKV